MEKCITKYREYNEKKLIFNRINRIEGQLKGIKNMIDNNIYCNDVLIQLSAVNNSIKSLSRFILNNHLQSCVKSELHNSNLDDLDEILKSLKIILEL